MANFCFIFNLPAYQHRIYGLGIAHLAVQYDPSCSLVGRLGGNFHFLAPIEGLVIYLIIYVLCPLGLRPRALASTQPDWIYQTCQVSAILQIKSQPAKPNYTFSFATGPSHSPGKIVCHAKIFNCQVYVFWTNYNKIVLSLHIFSCINISLKTVFTN